MDSLRSAAGDIWLYVLSLLGIHHPPANVQVEAPITPSGREIRIHDDHEDMTAQGRPFIPPTPVLDEQTTAEDWEKVIDIVWQTRLSLPQDSTPFSPPYSRGNVFRYQPRILLKTDSFASYVATEIVATRVANVNVKSFLTPHVLSVHPLGKWFAKNEIEGTPLDDCFGDLSEAQLDALAMDLTLLIKEMRSVPNNLATLGAVDGGPYENCVIPVHILPGPFTNPRDFVQFWKDTFLCPASILHLIFPDEQKARGHVDVLFEGFGFPSSCRVFFTHGDLNPRNIIVDPDTKRLVGVIDWAFAGWYPEYWESCRMWMSGTVRGDHWEEKWRGFVDKLFPQYAQEHAGYYSLMSALLTAGLVR